MIALSESSPQLPPSASSRDLLKATEAAKIAGCKVYHIPQDFPEGINADDALWHIPKQKEVTPAIWIGYIPYFGHYEAIYHAALNRNVKLVNNPSEFECAEEFDKFYPLISQFTAQSAIVTSLPEAFDAAEQLGYPIFLKGAIQSLKAHGTEACVAHSKEDLEKIYRVLLSKHRRSLGKVVLRQFLKLRHTRLGPGEFPLGREYRLFVLNKKILTCGYYWEGDDDLEDLSDSEKNEVFELVSKVAKCVKVPYIAVDVGQLESGEWIVIEIGDGQFSGISKTPIHTLWKKLFESAPTKFKS